MVFKLEENFSDELSFFNIFYNKSYANEDTFYATADSS
jgi:hypothetical protein